MNACLIDDDLLLIKDYQTCNPKPFRVLVDKYSDYVYKLLLFKGIKREEAKDCSQDIWLGFVKSLKKVDLKVPFQTYLRCAVTKRAIDYIRRLIRMREREMSIFMELAEDLEGLKIKLIDMLHETDDFLEKIDSPEISKNLRKCLGLIDNENVKLATALWLDGVSYREIAEIMNASVGTVSSWIDRGKKSIQKCMRKKYQNNYRPIVN